MDEVRVVVAHSERATLRVGDVFLKVDADQARLDLEVEAMSLTPVPTPEVLWRKPHVLAIAALPGTTLGRLGGPSTGSPTAWAAAGAPQSAIAITAPLLAAQRSPVPEVSARRLVERRAAPNHISAGGRRGSLEAPYDPRRAAPGRRCPSR